MIYIFGGAFDPPHVGHAAIVKSLLAKKHPEKIIIIPSSARNDKSYSVSDEHRLAMLEIFVEEIEPHPPAPSTSEKGGETGHSLSFRRGLGGGKVIIDDYFIKNWKGEMITRDVDLYARKKYGEDIVHIFGTDTIESMPSWDSEGYAAKVVRKLFMPRGTTFPFLSSRRDPFQNHIGEYVNENLLSEGERDSSQARNDKKNDWIASFLAMTERSNIENFELFTDSHIPVISSTELRIIIPEYTDLKAYYEESPKFIIPGLSKRISRYILDERLYREGSFAKELSRSDGGFFSETKSPVSFHSTPSLERGLKKPRILVHVCCGPDATMPILQLRDEYEVICFWYDPNIQPREEHDKRYDAFVKVCELEKISYIKGAYDVKHFFSRIKGLEHTPEKGEKCTNCYDMRMYVAAKLAARLKISLYTSSLNTSPKKDLEKLFAIGHKYARKFGIEFLDIPFRKRGGFEKSVEYTREHDIFRQNYCGCVYSVREGGESEMKGRMVG